MSFGPATSVLRSALGLSLPSAAIFAYFYGEGVLSGGQAVTFWLLSAAGIAAMVARHYVHLGRIDHAIRQLEEERPEIAVTGPTGKLGEIARAVSRHARWLARQRATLRLGLTTIERVLNGLPDPIIRIDEKTRIVGMNRPAELLFGKGSIGRDLVRVMRKPEVTEAVDAALGQGRDSIFEISVSGQVERVYSTRVVRLKEVGPDETAVIILLQDLTRIQLAERMRGDFVANASHELRTPLATLLGFIETIRGPARGDEQATDHFLEIMQQQTERMGRLVEDLLSLSRVELAELTPPTDRIDILDLLAKVKATLDLRAQGKGMTLNLVDGIAGIAGRTVIGDADQLSQVFQNLMDNAIKYGRNDSVVTIEVYRESMPPPSFPRSPDGAVAVSVSDQGEGIPREHLARLTERFYRVDKARSRYLGGTGLGLAIVKHIVSRHKGAMTIDSEVGQGSTFTVYLPSAPEVGDRARSEASEEPRSVSHNRNANVT
ncbi:MAG: ATP-binding protein [Alphaproteobacteria bacterium]|nr:ATP-binding protein [Alphaproteobacteria bacterium]